MEKAALSPAIWQRARRWAPFLFLIYRMGPRKPESKVLISDSIVRDFEAPGAASCLL